VQAFGGVTMSGATTAPTFGGSVAVGLGDSVQIFGEGGKLANLTTLPIDALTDLTGVNVGVSAYYGQAGVRILAGSDSRVRPYGEVSAGVARLHTGVSGLGEAGALIDTALRFTDRTEPILGLGAGLMIQSGAMVIDLGYRYKHIRGGDAVQQLLTGGDFGISQFRLGVGVRF
jgi:opacity protein-like surface antigen